MIQDFTVSFQDQEELISEYESDFQESREIIVELGQEFQELRDKKAELEIRIHELSRHNKKQEIRIQEFEGDAKGGAQQIKKTRELTMEALDHVNRKLRIRKEIREALTTKID